MRPKSISVIFLLQIMVLMSFLSIPNSIASPSVVTEATDPISYWGFNEGTGSIAVDTFNNNDGTIVGAEWVSGLDGNALAFNGDDYIEFADNDSLAGMTYEFTLEALFKLSSFGTENGNALFMFSTVYPVAGGQENVFAFWPSNIR